MLSSGKAAFEEDTKIIWPLEKLQAYFSHCKQFQPLLSTDASMVLTRYYQRQRKLDYPNMARTTVRLLQSSIRHVV